METWSRSTYDAVSGDAFPRLTASLGSHRSPSALPSASRFAPGPVHSRCHSAVQATPKDSSARTSAPFRRTPRRTRA